MGDDEAKQDYLVTWSINIQASSPEVAAWIALGVQQDPDSSAHIFDVRGDRPGDESIEIDLDALGDQVDGKS